MIKRFINTPRRLIYLGCHRGKKGSEAGRFWGANEEPLIPGRSSEYETFTKRDGFAPKWGEKIFFFPSPLGFKTGPCSICLHLTLK